MNAKSAFLGLTLAAFPLSGALADVSETREVDPFTKIIADGMMDVEITVGEEQSVTVTANRERYLIDTKTRVRDGTLTISTEDITGFFNFLRDIDVELVITVPSLESVVLDGMGNIEVTGVDSETFEITLDGMGNIEAEGRCGSGNFLLDGMGNLDARRLECERVRVKLDGMGNAEVFASEYADAWSDGMGSITIHGSPPDTDIREEGMGDIQIRE